MTNAQPSVLLVGRIWKIVSTLFLFVQFMLTSEKICIPCYVFPLMKFCSIIMFGNIWEPLPNFQLSLLQFLTELRSARSRYNYYVIYFRLRHLTVFYPRFRLSWPYNLPFHFEWYSSRLEEAINNKKKSRRFWTYQFLSLLTLFSVSNFGSPP